MACDKSPTDVGVQVPVLLLNGSEAVSNSNSGRRVFEDPPFGGVARVCMCVRAVRL